MVTTFLFLYGKSVIAIYVVVAIATTNIYLKKKKKIILGCNFNINITISSKWNMVSPIIPWIMGIGLNALIMCMRGQ
jgi:hypothetical protein